MNLALVASAIRDRIRADTGTGGLFNTSTGLLHNTDHPTYGTGLEERTFPYILFDIEDTQADEFDADTTTATVRIHIVDAREQGIGRCVTILSRLYGDGVSQANNEPSYGIHRHPLVVTQQTGLLNWRACGVMFRRSGSTQHDAECFVFEEVYEVRLSADDAGVSPK